MDKFYLILLIPSYLQFFFLPGIIFLFSVNYRTNFFSFLLFCLGISLPINYLLVFILSLFKFYTTFCLWLVFVFELIYLIKKRVQFNFFIKETINITLQNFSIIKKKQLGNLLLSALLLGLILIPLFQIIKDEKFGYFQVFLLGDVLHYYSKWARDWFYNQGVVETVFFRPQMWSANISIIYKFLNNEYYEIFTKPIFNIIYIYFLLGVIGIFLTCGNIFIFLGGILGTYYSYHGTFTLGNSGYMEIPLSFTMFILLVFIYDSKTRLNNLNSTILILPIFLSSIFLTKELGWLFGFPIILYIIFFKRLNEQKNLSYLQFFKLTFIFSIFFFPYYIYSAVYHDIFNLENPAIKLLTFDPKTHLSAGHGERYLNISTRVFDAVYKILNYTNYLVLPIIINFFFFLAKDKIIKFLISPFILFYLFIWATLMSNEFRYLYPIIVLSFISALVIIGDFFKNIKNYSLIIKNIYLIKILTITLVVAIFIAILLTNNKILNEKEILNYVDNKKIINFSISEKMIIKKLKSEIENNKFMQLNIAVDIYNLKIYAFSFLKNVNIQYYENLKPQKNQNYMYYVSSKPCLKLDELNFLVIYKNNGCIFKRLNPK